MILQLLSAVFGFAAPFLPQVVSYFQKRQDYAQELKMFELRMSLAAQEHAWKIEEINANADIAEMQTLRQPQQSFGVQLLDASKTWVESKAWGAWLVAPVFYLFSFLDWMTGMVRPTITFTAFGFYVIYKWTLIQSISVAQGREAAILATWGDQDWSVLVLVLSYYFGARTAKAAFGGSASTSKRDG